MNEENETKEKKKQGNVTISVTSGDFPLHLWNEWNEDCVKNFNNIRWVKIMSDHNAAKRERAGSVLDMAVGEIVNLDKRLNNIEDALTQKPEEKKEKEFIETLGGKQYE